MREEVQRYRPSDPIQADGGDVELIDVGDDGVVKVKLTGAWLRLPDGPDDGRTGSFLRCPRQIGGFRINRTGVAGM